jgi:hypothetical protein
MYRWVYDTPYSVVGGYELFGSSFSLHLHDHTAATYTVVAGFSENLVKSTVTYNVNTATASIIFTVKHSNIL